MNMQLRSALLATTATIQHVLHRDYETRSVVSLTDCGSWKYAADPRTEVRCVAYAVDNDPVNLWLPGEPVPEEFVEAARNPNWVACAHNANFEISIDHLIMRPRYGFPIVPMDRQRCTMAAALALALPPKLENLCQALETVHQKDKSGQRLMLMMSKPRRPRKDEDPQGLYWFEDEERTQRLHDYVKADVEAERECRSLLRPLSPEEQTLWQLDLRINARGVAVDRTLASAARKIAEAARPELDAELTHLTNGAVTRVTQLPRLKVWLAEQGCATDTLTKADIEKLLLDEAVPEIVRRVLDLRISGAQAAAKKIDALLARAGNDDRIRGALRYHGASTGRWSGNGVQPQNLKRPKTDDIDAAVSAIATGDYSRVRTLYPKPLSVIGDISRSLFVAKAGHRLIGGDFSSIESRALAWCSNENWKLDSYRRFDATRDPRDEPYCITACKIFQVSDGTFNKKSPERQVGKTCDLAFGYQGGLNAWRKFEPDRFTDEEVQQFKAEWRAAHPQIQRFWYAINDAAVAAVQEREHVVRCGRLLLKCTGQYLFIKLPSGRKLAYPFPRIVIVGDQQREAVCFKDASAGQWRDLRNGAGAYGGLWTENVISGICRDLLAAALNRLERAGYRPVLHIHDEVLCEVPDGFGSEQEFIKLMTVTPAWAQGLPIAASAWSGPRFCKS